jgi:hypothetical protein
MSAARAVSRFRCRLSSPSSSSSSKDQSNQAFKRNAIDLIFTALIKKKKEEGRRREIYSDLLWNENCCHCRCRCRCRRGRSPNRERKKPLG